VHDRLARATLLVAILTALPSGCAKRSGAPPETPSAKDGSPELALRVVPAPGQQYRPEEYLQLVARRVHVAPPKQSGFWRAVGSQFVNRSTSAILTVGVQVNGKTVGVLPLATVKVSSGNVTREVKANQPLTPPLRVQRGDQVTLQASLVEASEEAETRLVNATRTVGSLASLPVSTAVPGGGAAFDLAGQFWQLARAAGKPQDVTLRREGGLDRPLWETARLELVPVSDLKRFDKERDRLLDPDRVPRDDDPTFVVIDVQRRHRLYDPSLVLNDPSPIRDKIAIFLDEMREGGNVEKVKSCRRLRRYLRTTVGVNTADETAIVLAAMRETGYDPDRSQAHLDGCLSDQDIREARAAGFRWGSCSTSTACEVARSFAEAWFARSALTPLAVAPLAVYDRLGHDGTREDVDPGQFPELFRLEPGWEQPVATSDATAALRGVVSRDGQARPARVRLSITWEGSASPRVARVDLCDPAAPGCE
jgi:hypothetical protein